MSVLAPGVRSTRKRRPVGLTCDGKAVAERSPEGPLPSEAVMKTSRWETAGLAGASGRALLGNGLLSTHWIVGRGSRFDLVKSRTIRDAGLQTNLLVIEESPFVLSLDRPGMTRGGRRMVTEVYLTERRVSRNGRGSLCPTPRAPLDIHRAAEDCSEDKGSKYCDRERCRRARDAGAPPLLDRLPEGLAVRGLHEGQGPEDTPSAA